MLWKVSAFGDVIIISGAFKERTECVVRVERPFLARMVRLMMEFLYTNRIQDLGFHHPRSATRGGVMAGCHKGNLQYE